MSAAVALSVPYDYALERAASFSFASLTQLQQFPS